MARILIVEDEPMIAELLAELLADLGHRVTATGILVDAIEIAGLAEVDLALLDVNVVGGPTTAVARCLEERDIRFVVMSGDIAATTPYGAAPVLEKPFRAEALLSLLQKLLVRPTAIG
jgi:CheY-like chemotaxis protein